MHDNTEQEQEMEQDEVDIDAVDEDKPQAQNTSQTRLEGKQIGLSNGYITIRTMVCRRTHNSNS